MSLHNADEYIDPARQHMKFLATFDSMARVEHRDLKNVEQGQTLHRQRRTSKSQAPKAAVRRFSPTEASFSDGVRM